MTPTSPEIIPTRQSLLNRLKDRDDSSSWKDFFDTYWFLIYGVARKAGLTDSEAQDVVQETIISVARKIPEFTYDPVATDVATSVDEVLRGRRGVCQDFAHVQLACLRAFGLAARYVSGYLVTHHAPDEKTLIGADASHAWISVQLPGGEWLDLDPTNDVVPTDRHIVIAVGRDFGDVTPMRGVLLGGGRHELIVGVDVSPVEG